MRFVEQRLLAWKKVSGNFRMDYNSLKCESNELAKKSVVRYWRQCFCLEVLPQVLPSGYRSFYFSLSNLNQMDILSSISVPTLVLCVEMNLVTPDSESRIF
ncbi:hypothetical protein [Peribacillus simplex]|uniref:hypothetical protein n=1 Tax=Peribacillus simplex TaxID=1478 RepID=UPI003D2826C1